MPALSVKQQKLMQIAEHKPSEVYDSDKSVLNMSQGQLHDFSVGSEANKPMKVSKPKKFNI
jgi:hypothetical protein